MSGPVIPTLKIKGKHRLDETIRDIYAGYSRNITIPEKKTTEELHQQSPVDVTHKKFMGKKDDYYRYYYYKAYTKRKPDKRLVVGLPVMMQRKHKGRLI